MFHNMPTFTSETALNMNSSETSIIIYKFKWRHIQDNLNLPQYRYVTVIIWLGPQKGMWDCETSLPVIQTRFALFYTNVGQPKNESTIKSGQKHNISAVKSVDPITLEYPGIGPTSSRTLECSCWKLNRPYFFPSFTPWFSEKRILAQSPQ
jgi:hypothetical protein